MMLDVSSKEARNAELRQKFEEAVPSIQDKLKVEAERRQKQRQDNEELRGKLASFAEQAKLRCARSTQTGLELLGLGTGRGGGGEGQTKDMGGQFGGMIKKSFMLSIFDLAQREAEREAAPCFVEVIKRKTATTAVHSIACCLSTVVGAEERRNSRLF